MNRSKLDDLWHEAEEQSRKEGVTYSRYHFAELVRADERARMAEQPAQQEPVAWMHEWIDGKKIPLLRGRDARKEDQPKTVRPLVYGDTSPPARKPQEFVCSTGLCHYLKPLTDEPEIVQRVKRYAGQTLRTARNPNITARECIELAEWLAAHGIKENT